MRPRPILLASLSALGLSLFVWSAARTSAWAARQAQETRTETVAGTVHVFFGRGGNIGLCAGADGVLVIDDQFAELAPEIKAAIERLDEDGGGKPSFVLNTHFHGDHTGGNPIFGREAPILAHENVRARLSEPDRRGERMPPEGLPVITFADGISLHFNGETIRVVHYPAGHTDGDSAVFFEGSKVVHMGDLFFHERFPFVDLGSGGSVGGIVAAVTAVLARTDDSWRVIPGHGSLATRADLAAYGEMLLECQDLVRGALAEDKDVEAMLSEGLLGKYESRSWQFIDTKSFLEMLVADARAH